MDSDYNNSRWSLFIFWSVRPQFFPYVLLLVAVLMYAPTLIWRFVAAPLMQSDLGFIMEELDRCYNSAVTLAKRLATSGLLISDRYGSPAVDFRSSQFLSDQKIWNLLCSVTAQFILFFLLDYRASIDVLYFTCELHMSITKKRQTEMLTRK